MKENKYDDNIFFQKYSQMSRSQQGLAGAGEWETLRKLLPDFKDKRVLDLGCGYGWHCIYAMEHGASSVVGVDISHKMLEVAKENTHFPQRTGITLSLFCPTALRPRSLRQNGKRALPGLQRAATAPPTSCAGLRK